MFTGVIILMHQKVSWYIVVGIKITNCSTSSYNKNRKLKFSEKNIGKSNAIQSFGSNTSAGAPLKVLSDICCAYFGKKMILGSLMTKIEQQLNTKFTIESATQVLLKYIDNMLDVERKMFENFVQYSLENPKGVFTDYLKKVSEESLTKLKLEELFVLDDIDMLARELSPKTSFTLRKKTTKCRDIILRNDSENVFKRKTLLSSLDEIQPINGEEELLELIKDRAEYLPTSGSSENAFVIKYLERSHDEISKRLLRSSVQTVEHVLPDSLGGQNNLSNFVLTTSYANSCRSNRPLDKHIARFPEIPQNSQKYINDIIGKMNKGKMKGHETYPFDIKRTLENESKGKIVLDLSNYQYSEAEAINRMKQKKVFLYNPKNG